MSATILTHTTAGTAWDAFVESSPGASFCHLSGWRDIMSDVLGHDCRYAAMIDDDGYWQGVLPLVSVRSPIFGRFVVSMPFLNYGGPLGTPTAQARLSQLAVDEARRVDARLVELRCRYPIASDLELNPRKVAVVMRLPEVADKLWSGFPSKLRSQVRRAMKAELESRFGLDQAGAFYEVFARNMRDLGTPVMPRRWFEAIADAFPALVQFGAIYHRGTPVAAGCGFVWRGEFEMTWASSLREFNHLAPNMLLYWSFMERMVGLGLERFNFGRCTPEGGTYRFKLQWGAKDEPLPWVQWSPVSVDATPSPGDAAYRVASAVWRRLPLQVTNRVGPTLARVIP